MDFCGLGQFVFYLNGIKVGDHELDPGWTDYRKYIEYVHFDVSDLLKKGKNVIGCEVGNGWFIKDDEHYTFRFPEFMPPNPNPYVPFGDSLVIAMRLCVRYVDGKEDVICCDDRFRVIEHPMLHSNVYGSEVYDAWLIRHGWLDNTYDDSEWRNAIVVVDGPKGMVE